MTVITEDVIARFQQGDPEAERALYDETIDFIYSIVYRILPTEAEDLVQDIYIRIFQQRKAYRGEAKITTWMYRIAMNTLLNYRRRQKLWAATMGRLVSPEVTEADTIETKVLITALLAELPADAQMILVICDVEEHTYEEAAAILAIPVNTVRSRLFRARQRLTLIAKKRGVV